MDEYGSWDKTKTGLNIPQWTSMQSLTIVAGNSKAAEGVTTTALLSSPHEPLRANGIERDVGPECGEDGMHECDDIHSTIISTCRFWEIVGPS
jgi:hypothetical protein